MNVPAWPKYASEAIIVGSSHPHSYIHASQVLLGPNSVQPLGPKPTNLAPRASNSCLGFSFPSFGPFPLDETLTASNLGPWVSASHFLLRAGLKMQRNHWHPAVRRPNHLLVLWSEYKLQRNINYKTKHKPPGCNSVRNFIFGL